MSLSDLDEPLRVRHLYELADLALLGATTVVLVIALLIGATQFLTDGGISEGRPLVFLAIGGLATMSLRSTLRTRVRRHEEATP